MEGFELYAILMTLSREQISYRACVLLYGKRGLRSAASLKKSGMSSVRHSKGCALQVLMISSVV
jgi:hypothetical protein